jgi:uncharacterized protein YdeI (YjbR/CyaY-like superfamily)
VGPLNLYPNKTMVGKLPHTLPSDLKNAIGSTPGALEKWESLTPLARNEYICWTTSVKKAETREEHVKRVCEDMLNGKRRPCCWPGCPHRKK